MLTDTKLKHLKAREKNYKIADRDGLYVLVTPAGSVTFRYDYRINNRRETLTIGRYGPEGINLVEARGKLAEAKWIAAHVQTASALTWGHSPPGEPSPADDRSTR